MVQTENVDSSIVLVDNNVEIRTFDECLDIYKTQVNIFTVTLVKNNLF